MNSIDSQSLQAYYNQVWEVVKRIPFGKIVTYGQIASMVSPPAWMSPQRYFAMGAILVGRAMAACPEDLPWHRVINARGQVSPRKSGGHIQQIERLRSEGVPFNQKGHIEINKCRWKP